MPSDMLSSTAPPPQSRVPFRVAGGAQPLLLVPVRVNDEGPYQFILDTGAGTTLLSPPLADSLGVQTTGSKRGQTAGGVVEARTGVLDSLGVGEVRRQKVDVAILDLSALERAVGASVDGDLGYNFLKDFRLTIDFRASALRLDDPKRCEYFGPPPLVELPIQLAHPAKPLILVEAYLNERGPFRFAIDTGTSTTAIAARLAHDLQLETRPIGTVTIGGAPIAMQAARLQSLGLGSATVRDLDILVGDFLEVLSQATGTRLDGIVGYNFLRHYRVGIDYPNNAFSLFAA